MFYKKCFKFVLFSDSNNTSAPIALDALFPEKTNSRSNLSAESESTAVFNPDGGLSEILNSLSLNDALTRNCFDNSEFRNLDLVNLQNLQAIHAFKYSQQSPALVNSLFNSNYSQSASQVKTDCLMFHFIIKIF